MKPLVATAEMKEVSRNGFEIMKALSKCFTEHPEAYRCLPCSSTSRWDSAFQFKVIYIRSTGFIESERCTVLADSPDGLIVYTNENQFTSMCAVEVQTMTSLPTIEEASLLRDK